MGREGRKGETRLDKKGLESRTRPLSTLFDRRFFFRASHLLITPALWSSNRTGGFKTRRMPGLFCSSRTMKISGTERRFDSPLLRPRGTSDRIVYCTRSRASNEKGSINRETERKSLSSIEEEFFFLLFLLSPNYSRTPQCNLIIMLNVILMIDIRNVPPRALPSIRMHNRAQRT